MELLTVKTFNENNRTKVIGHSMYRICNTNTILGNGKWYIHETYNDGKSWGQGNAYRGESLEDVIDVFNVIDKERAIVETLIGAPLSVEKMYDYYYLTFKNGLNTLADLQKKYKDWELHRAEWERSSIKSIYAARDYESYNNAQEALKRVIDAILQQQKAEGLC